MVLKKPKILQLLIESSLPLSTSTIQTSSKNPMNGQEFFLVCKYLLESTCYKKDFMICVELLFCLNSIYEKSLTSSAHLGLWNR